MRVKQAPVEGCFIVEPKVHIDKRGHFFETFNKANFLELTGLKVDFVQDNQSFSSKGVLRGLHFQKGKHAQAKLIRAVKGQVLDVAVDIRKNSPTFGSHFSLIISEKNQKQLYIPRGFAHGFVVLSETAIISYKCDNFYNKNAESGIVFNDPYLNINWLLEEEKIINSERDKSLPLFKELCL
jgi:dTDP-4-dehydrorhamnose 3,5-epimerase